MCGSQGLQRHVSRQPMRLRDALDSCDALRQGSGSGSGYHYGSVWTPVPAGTAWLETGRVWRCYSSLGNEPGTLR